MGVGQVGFDAAVHAVNFTRVPLDWRTKFHDENPAVSGDGPAGEAGAEPDDQDIVWLSRGGQLM